MTWSVLVRPVRSLAEDSGSGLACASTFGPRCACLGSSESNFQKRGQFAGGAIRRRAAFKVCEVPSANDVLAHPPFSMRPEVAFGSSTRERRDKRSPEVHLHLSVLDLL